MHGRLCVCEREKGHEGAHEMYWPGGVTWTWTDRQLHTIYPEEAP